MSNLAKLESKVKKLLSILEDPHPGLSSWVSLYRQISSEITDFLLGDALPKEWKKALNNGWKIVPCSCSCGGSFAWLNQDKMFGCVCHNNPTT